MFIYVLDIIKCKQNPMKHQLMHNVYYFKFASEKLTRVRQNLVKGFANYRGCCQSGCQQLSHGLSDLRQVASKDLAPVLGKGLWTQ